MSAEPGSEGRQDETEGLDELRCQLLTEITKKSDCQLPKRYSDNVGMIGCITEFRSESTEFGHSELCRTRPNRSELGRTDPEGVDMR